MRKDVKLGFAIGSVLLAVLVAYVLVVPEREPSDVQLVDADGNPIVVPSVPPIAMNESSSASVATPVDAVSAEEAALLAPTASGEATVPSPTSGDDAVATNASPAGNNADVDWEALLGGGDVLMTRTPTAAPANEAAAPLPPTEPAAVFESSDLTAADVKPHTGPVAQSGAPTTRPLSGGTRTHTVQRGETLSSISKAAYGSANFYPHIIRANAGLDPARLKVGTLIQLPDISDVVPTGEGTASASAGRSLDAKAEYRVQSGDSLYSISTRLYGSAARMSELYELNKQTIGADPSKLKLNTILKLPAPPTETASR